MIKIAFADDHQALIDGVKMLLENTPNFEFIGAARNGVEMIKLLENNRVDVVITDLKMPDMDGFSLTQEIKQGFPELKVVVFSMFDQPEAVKKASDAGADAYVLKTSSLDVLILAIQKIIDGNMFYDEDISRDLKQTADLKPNSVLSSTEQKILSLIANGKTSEEIADVQNCAISTVYTHRKNMAAKLKLKGKNELLKYAVENKYNFS
jgi:two-component system nitrate/nitrite response regulator NarL